MWLTSLRGGRLNPPRLWGSLDEDEDKDENEDEDAAPAAASPASCKMPDFTHPGERQAQEGELGKNQLPPRPPDIQPRKGKKLLCDFNWLWSTPVPG